MTTQKQVDVVGVFAERTEAERALDDLVRAGFPRDRIELRVRTGEGPLHPTKMGPPKLKAKAGATLGGMIGGIIGCLAGTLITTGVIPGIPPLLDGAAVAGIIGAVAGLAIGGLGGAVIGWAIEADEDSFYAHELERGRTLVTVHGNGRSTEAAAILRRNQASGVRAASSVLSE
jgi:hypothetical protein